MKRRGEGREGIDGHKGGDDPKDRMDRAGSLLSGSMADYLSKNN